MSIERTVEQLISSPNPSIGPANYMYPANTQSTAVLHVVAVPVPGRSHVNPMMSLCKLLASKTQDIIITIVVTEEWLGLIDSDDKPANLRLASIPNDVVFSEQTRGVDFPAFYEAVQTKMEGPFQQLFDELEPPVNSIIADSELPWAIHFGNCRNIPVAALITTSATFFSRIQYFSQIPDRDSLLDLLGKGDDAADNPVGIFSREFRTIYGLAHKRTTELSLLAHSWASKSQYLLLNSVQELEPQVFDALKLKFSCPIYPIGPAIPYLDLEHNSSTTTSPPNNGPNYLEWLDSQPADSVLYVSFGSFLSVSSQQIDELSAGLQSSGVRYLWVARGQSSGYGEKGSGFVVPWCNQIKVLCHASVGGFLTHCGWNSTLEGLFAGLPRLTFPIVYDQVLNDKQIVEDWEIGWRVGGRIRGNDSLVSREEITERVKKFMDEESVEVQNMRRKAKGFREVVQGAKAKGGSSDRNLDAFIKDISQANCH